MLRGAAGAAATCVLCWLSAAPAIAQDSRADLLARQRTEKAAALHPVERSRLEKILLSVDTRDPAGRIAPRNGFFVRYGYYQKPVGAGVGIGGGFRHDLFGHQARLVLEGGETFRNYQLLRGDLSMPWLADQRLDLGVEGSYRHHPQEDFYGIGDESLVDDRVSFRLNLSSVLGRAVFRPRPWLEAGVHAGRIAPSVGPGTDSRYPSIEARFDDADTPGLAGQPAFGYADVYAAIDYRDQPGNARTGGYYTATWSRYADDEAGDYDFRQLELRGLHFFPIFDEKRVFAVQARVVTSYPGDAAVVPFYFQPTLGGSTTLRSVSDYRFRDDNLMQLNVEYRWEAFSGLDMALFNDWGEVGSTPGDLDFGDLKHAYGIGFRFNTAREVILRFDVGLGGSEGVHYNVRFSKAY